jgi:hypothetical protein
VPSDNNAKARIWCQRVDAIHNLIYWMKYDEMYRDTRRFWCYFDGKYWCEAPTFASLLEGIKEIVPYAKLA